MTDTLYLTETSVPSRPMRIGFLGLGWIGRHRMQAMLDTGAIQAVAISDPSQEAVDAALQSAPGAAVCHDLDDLLSRDLDGLVIATPSALHASQSIAALEAGVAVFCQKPLGRSGDEVRAVVEAARRNDRLLGVDLSYRYAEPMQQIRSLLKADALGRVFSVDLTFHNAYGPDKPWFYDRSLSGGGCVMDLAIHLVDLALWALDFPEVEHVSSHLMSAGVPLESGDERVEDFAAVTLTLSGGTVVRLACSWRLQAGCDAVIKAAFYGTEGGALLSNVDGSFYHLTAERFRGTSREALGPVQDDWGGLAAMSWAKKLAVAPGYDPACEALVASADVIDRIYAGQG